MPLVTSKRVWTQQPQVAVEIDWSNPITNSLIFASAGNDFAWSNVSGYHLLVIGNGGPKNVPYNSGILKGFNTNGSGTTDRLVTKEVAFANTGFFSMISHMMPVGYGGGNFARITNPEGSTGVDSGCWSSMYNGPADGNIVVVNYPTTETALSAGVPGAFTLNEWQSHAQVINLDAIATYPEVYKNGLALSGVAWNAGLTPTGVAISGTVTIGIGNRGTDSARYFDGLIGPILMFQRRLFPSEIKSLHDNPWSIFKRQDRRIWIPSAGGGDVTIACTPGNATTAGITAGISSATTIACNVGNASTAGVACALPTTISCNAGNTTTSGIACSLPVVVQCGVGTATTAGVTAGISLDTSITIACNAGNATAAGVAAGISLDTSITISCNVGTATTAGVTAGISSATTITCNAGTATTAGVSATFPQSLSCNVGNATTSGITAQVDIAGQIVIGCNAGTATTAGISAGISSAFVLACNVGNATTIGTTAYFPQVLQCSPGNAIALGINATFTVAGPTAIVCNVGNATASGISFSFGGTLVDAPNGSGPAIIRPQTIRPPNVGGIRI